MSTVADLTKKAGGIYFGNDNIVIRDVLESIRGGRTLDTTGYPLDLIHGGHVIIEETATKTVKPFPLTSDGKAYGSLPAGHTIVGINIATIRKDMPFSGYMNRGSVNPNASVIPLSNILSAVKAALPLVTFLID